MRKTIAFENAYPLIEKYVKYFYRSQKFYSVAHEYEEEDMVQSVCVKWLQNGYLSMYDPNITSEKYFIMTGVKLFFVDTIRAQKEALSLDKEIGEEGFTLKDTLVDPQNLEEEIVQELSVQRVLDKLSDETESKIRVVSPLGEFKATMRTFALHLYSGYTQAEIARFCINPKTGRPVTRGRITQYVKELRVCVKEIYGTV